MAGRIQGITVEIGGDTTKLQTALHHIEQHQDRRQAEYQVRGKESEAVPGEE